MYGVSGVEVDRITFQACDRSGWAVQCDVKRVDFHDSRFLDIGKAAVDMEPTCPGAIGWIDMYRLHVRDDDTISVAGQADSLTHDVTLSDSQVGGRVGITYSRNVTLSDVHIAGIAKGGEGSLHIRGGQDVRMLGGSIARLAGSVAGSAVKMVGANGFFPRDVTLSGVRITSELAGNVISIESATDVTMLGNTVVGPGTAVWAKGIGQPLSGLLITTNRLRAPVPMTLASAAAGSVVTGNL